MPVFSPENSRSKVSGNALTPPSTMCSREIIRPSCIQAAISRQREYLADASSAMITRNPPELESALAKLGQYGRPVARQNFSMAHMWVADPNKPGFISKIFGTHPPIPDRIARLQKIGGSF